MDREYYLTLSNVRLDRAKELLDESKELLKNASYKSANNRAYYSIEKCIKALLATEGLDVATHNGALKQFNFIFIYKGHGYFVPEDYQIVAKAEQIRTASDYDDFYLADKKETMQQVENATYFLEKVEKYIKKISN